MAFTKIDHIVFCLQILFYNLFCLLWTKILPFHCMMVEFGSIYYAGNMLIRHLCEHDADILFTSAFKMAELYRFIQICLQGTSKNGIVFSPLLFSGGQSSLLWECPVKCDIGHIALLFITDNLKIHESTTYCHTEYKVYNKFLLYLYQDG